METDHRAASRRAALDRTRQSARWRARRKRLDGLADVFPLPDDVERTEIDLGGVPERPPRAAGRGRRGPLLSPRRRLRRAARPSRIPSWRRGSRARPAPSRSSPSTGSLRSTPSRPRWMTRLAAYRALLDEAGRREQDRDGRGLGWRRACGGRLRGTARRRRAAAAGARARSRPGSTSPARARRGTRASRAIRSSTIPARRGRALPRRRGSTRPSVLAAFRRPLGPAPDPGPRRHPRDPLRRRRDLRRCSRASRGWRSSSRSATS